MGAGPSLRSVLRALKADAFAVAVTDDESFVFGISWERRPVDSSHACGGVAVGLVEVTAIKSDSFDP